AGRDLFARAAAIYAERYGDPEGRIPAQFQLLFLTGWMPHESQQVPLRPGSARRRLADALGTVEQPAGDRAGPEQWRTTRLGYSKLGSMATKGLWAGGMG